MSAWANVGAAAAEEGAAGAAAAEAKPAENGEGDAVWADFAQKAAEVEQQKEQQKKQAAEEAAKVGLWAQLWGSAWMVVQDSASCVWKCRHAVMCQWGSAW